ncbi:MAG TPA: beta-CASP ribonuclease aCPSF1 [Candidatus Deferrimicrobium sp.]|nr:beta-CASP ribonuclease aCPSF1 [Candidatus Deferrimicrobium sp.]
MLIETILADLKDMIIQNLPSDVNITSIEFEGPEIALYSKNPKVLLESREIVKDIAKKLRKRLVIRSDPSVRLPQDETQKIIMELCPEEAGITAISFDPNVGEVIIEAKKPGLVIGRGGLTLKQITESVLWRPSVIRTPPLTSNMVLKLRHAIKQDSEKRKKLLKKIGMRIHRPIFLKDEYVRLTSLGGFREVGRSCILIQTAKSNVLLDCGISVGSTSRSEIFPYLNVNDFNIEDLDAIIVGHAHLDHQGLVPFLFKYGYDGPIYCTKPTRNLMTLLQLDYLDVSEREGKMLPYSQKEVKKSVLHTIPLDYGEVTDIAPDIRLTLHNAGHILGSSIIHLHIGDGLYNLAYTGDFKYAKTRLLEPASTSFPRLETLIIESTYGAPKDTMPARRESEKLLATVINNTIRSNGKVLIPVLAVGRAQELLIVIEDNMRRGLIDEVPVYIDGLISEATAIHTTHPEYLSRDLREMIFHQGMNPFLSEYFVQVDASSVRSDVIHGEPCIIMATSGMMTGGPSVEYFRQLADNPNNTLIFVSYQVEGTLGRRIQKGYREIPMKVNHDRVEAIHVKINIVTNEGFSGHSSRQQIINFIRKVEPQPERIITNHGENSKCTGLASAIHKLLHIETRAPQNLETIRLK